MKREQSIKSVGSSGVYMFSDYVSPKIQDVKVGKGSKYVLWGANNDFYDHLRDLYLNSTTNNAAINGIIKLVYGDGLSFDDSKREIKMSNVISPVEMRRILLQFYVYNKFVAQVEYHMTDEGQRDIEKGIRKVFFLPAKDVAPCEKNEDGEIETYYTSKDWSSPRSKDGKPKPVPAFGCGSNEDEIEIYFWQLMLDNDEYYSPVSYHGCLQYAENEVEIANYHLNHIIRGFAPSGIINFNNGVPEPEERRKITRDFVGSKTGSENAGKAFITFNESAENAVTIAAYDIPDPHRQYEFISNLCEKEILLSHNISSPLLFGIRDTSGGLGSNANEIRESYEIMREMTLEPIRGAFLEGLEPLLLAVGIPAIPKFSDLEIFRSEGAGEVDASYTGIQISSALDILSRIQIGELTEEQGKQLLISMLQIPFEVAEAMVNTDPNYKPPTELHKHKHAAEPDSYAQTWMDALESKGEVISEEWEQIGESAVENPELEDQILSTMNFNTTPADGQPEDASEDGDSGLFKVRYRYGPIRNSADSRDLCKYLEQKASQNVVYRKEDIDSWEDEGVNSQFAPEGKSKYSLWLWKGGAYCHHKWYRVIFFRKRNPDGTFKKKSSTAAMENDKRVSQPQARSQGLPEKKLNPPGWPDAGTAPIDQPNRGSLKNS